jgi:hypothetical protein
MKPDADMAGLLAEYERRGQLGDGISAATWRQATVLLRAALAATEAPRECADCGGNHAAGHPWHTEAPEKPADTRYTLTVTDEATGEVRSVRHLNEEAAHAAAEVPEPHPILVKYGLETMAGDPLEVLERHLVANCEATIGAWKLAATEARHGVPLPSDECPIGVRHPHRPYAGCDGSPFMSLKDAAAYDAATEVDRWVTDDTPRVRQVDGMTYVLDPEGPYVLGWSPRGLNEPGWRVPDYGAATEAPATSPFRAVTDELTGGDGCACHTGRGYNTTCSHCRPATEAPAFDHEADCDCPCHNQLAAIPSEIDPEKLARVLSDFGVYESPAAIAAAYRDAKP